MQIQPFQVTPGQAFDVFYFIRNHTDNTTYYVRSVIYDIHDGTIIDTVDLEQSPANPRLFIKTVTAPPDPTGLGRNIASVATVYEDSGHTTKSQSYEEQEQYFLVKNSLNEIFGSGGGGGFDWRYFGEFMEEFLEKIVSRFPTIPEFPEIPQLPEMPFGEVLANIGYLEDALEKLPTEKADLTGVTSLVTELRDMISKLPPPEKFDSKPLQDAISEVTALVRKQLEAGQKEMLGTNKKYMDEMLPVFKKELLKAFSDFFGDKEVAVPFKMLLEGKGSDKEEMPDVSHLMNK